MEEKFESKYKMVFEAGSNPQFVDINDNHGTINLGGKGQQGTPNEEDEWMAIDDLLEATDEQGQRLMTDSAQWYAVFRVMTELCNWPRKMTDFVRLMREHGFDEAQPAVVYESVKKGNLITQLACKVSMWQKFKNLSEPVTKQCVVAAWLIDHLGLS